jgi:hypothetical protein
VLNDPNEKSNPADLPDGRSLLLLFNQSHVAECKGTGTGFTSIEYKVSGRIKPESGFPGYTGN